MSYRYQLDKTSKKTVCPKCGKRRFVRYIDMQENTYLPEKYGRCDRQDNCGYHLNPYSDNYGKDKAGYEAIIIPSPIVTGAVPVSFMDDATAMKSLKNYGQNYFILYLKSLFPDDLVEQLVQAYEIGTSKHWEGSTVFWQKDISGKYRTGKIMLYDPLTGKRVKKPFNHISWAHSAMKLTDFHLTQCYFGEHLLVKEPEKPIAIVESEKTAIIASAYYPEYIWLGTGGTNGCRWHQYSVGMVLKNRDVFLFPDLSIDGKAFFDWKEKAEKLSRLIPSSNFYVSELLEAKATDDMRRNGADIADYLVGFDVRTFNVPNELSETDASSDAASSSEEIIVVPKHKGAQDKQTNIQKEKPKPTNKSDREIGKQTRLFKYNPGVFTQRFSLME